MAELFSRFAARSVTFRNRIGVSPMCQYSSKDGFVNDWHLVHLGSRAVGGAGLVIVEASAVEAQGRISPADVGIWKDDHIEALGRVAAFLKQHSAVAAIQLAHAGRKASTRPPWMGGSVIPPGVEDGWQTVAPSPIPFHDGDPAPAGLSLMGIQSAVLAFEQGARRALAAGFDAVEIHGAHGYLIHQFLSPLSNQRTDEYGGCFENRIRFALDVTKAVRRVWPESLPLLFRVSAQDWAEGGWTLEESVELARRLKGAGVDLIDCSSGGTVPHARIGVAPGYQVPFAERIRREAGIATAAVGMITGAEQAEAIVASGKADLVLMARELLRDPYWPLHAARILGVEPEAPPQYKRAFA